jgi:hypothetical protein
MFANAKGVVIIGKHVTEHCPWRVPIAIPRIGTYRERNPVEPRVCTLLNDLRALEHEIRATGLAEYAAVVDRAVQELCRVHADAKVAEQIILPDRN